MASEVGICNEALSLLGEPAITALSEDSKPGRACNLIYTESRDALVEAFPWRFSIKRATLAQLAETPVSGYAYKYALPADYLRILDAEYSYYDYRVEDKKLLTDQDSMIVRYIAQVEDPNQMTPMFRELLAAKLAVKLAIPITDSNQRKQDAVAEYMRLLVDARSIGSFEDSVKTIESTTWTDIRT